jgi:hypothetical protein
MRMIVIRVKRYGTASYAKASHAYDCPTGRNNNFIYEMFEICKTNVSL